MDAISRGLAGDFPTIKFKGNPKEQPKENPFLSDYFSHIFILSLVVTRKAHYAGGLSNKFFVGGVGPFSLKI